MPIVVKPCAMFKQLSFYVISPITRLKNAREKKY